MDYAKIRDIEREELHSTELSKLPDDFYSIAKQLEQEFEEKMRVDPQTYYREYEGLKKSLENIRRKRIEKIIFSASVGEEPANMLPLEKELFDKIIHSISEFEQAIRSVEAKKPKPKDDNKARLRIIKHVPQYIGADGKTSYGPFTPGDEITIDKGEAEWLVSNGYAEYA
jgi:DNA replication initiation complex subunit (GINS family)